MPNPLPKRLIEVDLPIKRISAHARREKSIRHGHISTLHIWWARRPLAACRAVICAALWPDPADPLCPQAFIDTARREMLSWSTHERQQHLSSESRPRFEKARHNPALLANPAQLRAALLDFIADFANWDNSTKPDFLATSRALTQSAHESLGGEKGTRPLVVDPFAGGGSIPLEALRVGADAFASDLNPVPVLLNKVVLEYIPKYGQRLADEVRKWGEWIKKEAEKELAEFYPKDKDGATPIAYLWARTIQCEGPGCGAEVPLIRSLWLAKKSNRSVALQLIPRPRAKRVDFQIIAKQHGEWVDQDNPKIKIEKPKFDGTVARGSATCPCCGFTTPVTSVRIQMKERNGGARDARLFCVVTTKEDEQGRFYRLPTEADMKVYNHAAQELAKRQKVYNGLLSMVPDEPLPPQGSLGFRVQLYGIEKWGQLFTPRQLLALTTLVRLCSNVGAEISKNCDKGLADAVMTGIAAAINTQADSNSSLCSWRPTSADIGHTFGRQAIPMFWDFVEGNIFSGASRDWMNAVRGVLKAYQGMDSTVQPGQVRQASADKHPLPDDSAQCFCSDPPYYDAVPYSDLSDFFYVWFKRTLGERMPELFSAQLAPKEDECIVDEIKGKDKAYFEKMMGKAMAEGRRVLAPNGIGIVVFAHKSTSGWESQLQAMIEAGWIMTGSWPIDTEMGSRLRAMNSAALASSVHLVCRPRENPDGSVRTNEIGDWRDVLAELPKRIHEWMPRLASEGVVGADAIFACLGPALEIFSRYSRVEKASGEQVTLREYLEHVWAAVSREALSSLITDTDLSSLESDARITAMWLWTLNSGSTPPADTGENPEDSGDGETDDESESAGKSKPAATGGYVLEYDAARKIAQGLGADLDSMKSVVEVKGDKARLLPVEERTAYLFGKEQSSIPDLARRTRKKDRQLTLSFAELASADDSAAEAVWEEKTVSKPGATVLDRVHQSMILFATGRGAALRRFLVDDGAGAESAFWKLAQALSALYPNTSQEKRWVDGVLARKKGLGL